MRQIAAALLCTLFLVADRPAAACGCFVPPDPTVPIVQAGERILFARDNNQIVAHIQIQYAGQAKDFGWLLPLPSVPALELGTDELFTKLSAATQPSWSVDYVYPTRDNCVRPPAPDLGGYGASDLASFSSDMSMGGGPPTPVVLEDSIGPYDYAVLKADNKDAMLAWLAANHYFVPIGTDDVLSPYLHKGAFFLALKLKSGKSAGDLQPVVVRYDSDLPMIPIVLTSTAAQKHMGIAVWLLGDGRAVPRNYYHTVLDDAALDWVAGAHDYRDLLIRAVAEAPGKHSFVTEFAGSAAPFKTLLDAPGRYGSVAELQVITDPYDYVQYLRNKSFYFGGALIGILQRYFPIPVDVLVNPATYYYNLDLYRQRIQGLPPDLAYDAVALTDEIEQRVVQPARAAAQLFATYPYLTRLFTTLSPEDMTRDPVFSWNPFLPDVPLAHRATFTYRCPATPSYGYDASLLTEQGFSIDYPGAIWHPLPQLPASLRIEILRDAGLPEVVTDNTAAIRRAIEVAPPAMGGKGAESTDPIRAGGCSVEPTRSTGHPFAIAGAAVALLGALWFSLRRRSR